MTLELQFDKHIFIQTTKLQFNLVWKKNIDNNYKRLIWIILAFIIAFFLIFNKNHVGFLFLAIGIHFSIRFIEYLNFYKKNKKAYLSMVNEEIDGFENSSQNIILGFEEEYFKYSDYKHESKTKWFVFKDYKVIEGVLFLYTDNKNTVSFTLSKAEIKETEWTKIIEIINTKINLNT